MSTFSIYPLKIKPVFKYKLWGGRRLKEVLPSSLPPGDDIIGEACLLDNNSEVMDGEMRGKTIEELMRDYPVELLGQAADRYHHLPFVVKLADAQHRPSVQVHPADELTAYLPEGETGKTEAWVVLKAGPQNKIYAGLKPETTPERMKEFLENGQVEQLLYSFTPSVGDAVFIKPGTVHTMEDVVVFGIEQNSHVTFRLYDWDRIDHQTGKTRELQVKEAMGSIDFSQGSVKPVEPVIEEASPVMREKLFDCKYFRLWRIKGEKPFQVGELKSLRVLACIVGKGCIDYEGSLYPVEKGDVFLLPAALGSCSFRPEGTVVVFAAGVGSAS